MSQHKKIKPRAEAFFDKEEMEAYSYFKKYFIEGIKEHKLLLKASIKYKESKNPDNEKISKLMKGLYFYEKGLSEIKNRESIIYFNKAIEYLSDVDIEMERKAKFNKLKRLLEISLKKDKPGIYLLLAELSREMGNEKDANSFMTLYGMGVLPYLTNTMSNDDLANFLNVLVSFAEKSKNDDILYKVKSAKYEIEASRVGNPLGRIDLMEKSLEMINLTKDKYGKELAETGIEYEKAMLISSKLKRNKALSLVGKKYLELGVNKQAEFIQNLISYLPEKMAHQIKDIDQIVIRNGILVKIVSEIGRDNFHSSFFYSNSYFISGIKKIGCIIKRIAVNKKKLTHLHIERRSIESSNATNEKAKMKIVWRKEREISEQMQIDLESLYVFGNVLIDHWSKMMISLVGKNPSEFSFNKLYKELSKAGYKGSLLSLWEKHKEDIIWIYYHLRQYRNFFIEHF